MSTNQALAVAVATFDGHNPNITRRPDGMITLHTGRPNGPSDLDLAIDELLYEDIGGVRIARQHPTFSARELASAMVDVAAAALASVGHSIGELDPAAVADHLRTRQRTIAATEHGGEL